MADERSATSTAEEVNGDGEHMAVEGDDEALPIGAHVPCLWRDDTYRKCSDGGDDGRGGEREKTCADLS